MSPGPPTVEVAEAPAHEVERVTVAADRLSFTAGRVTAEGHVIVHVGDEVLEAEAVDGTAEDLTVQRGVWYRADGVVRFENATINLRARSGVIAEASLVRDGVTLDAQRIAIDESAGVVRADQARLEPCACADGHRPALSFRARSVELIGAEVAVIRGGTVRVFDVPIVPVPYWREALDPRQFRLSFPQVSYGSLGFSASEHARFGVGPELLEIGPAWREDRGGRLDVAMSGPVTLEGAVGWDSVWESPRGAGVTRGGFADATRRLAWDVTAQSDPLYAEHYGPSWVDRGVLWHDSRALAQTGPLRATAWIPDDESTGKHATLRYRPELSRAGWAAAPWVEAGVASAPYVMAGADARASHTGSVLHAEATVAAAGVGQVGWGGAPLAQGFAGAMGRAEVPFWGEIGKHRVQFFTGARVEAEVGDPLGTPLRIHPGIDGTAFGAGPTLRASAALGPNVLSGEATALLGLDGGITPKLTINASSEAWSARAESDGDAAALQLQTRGVVALDVGALLAPDAQLGWADLTWHPGRLVLGGGASRGFSETDPLTGSARLGYDDGCSSLVLSAAFSPDRALPDVGLALALRK
ncbi:hypothetical protein LBMAG42_42340 [Deltaproteobacteria bacterium]|nr:hypothetical protein LBMAG42_42340 [Deltaproteobacteria bacterium]